MKTDSRYRVVDGSASGHCCFEASVVDTHAQHPIYKDQPVCVCECFEVEDAERIAKALNAAEGVPDALD